MAEGPYLPVEWTSADKLGEARPTPEGLPAQMQLQPISDMVGGGGEMVSVPANALWVGKEKKGDLVALCMAHQTTIRGFLQVSDWVCPIFEDEPPMPALPQMSASPKGTVRKVPTKKMPVKGKGKRMTPDPPDGGSRPSSRQRKEEDNIEDVVKSGFIPPSWSNAKKAAAALYVVTRQKYEGNQWYIERDGTKHDFEVMYEENEDGTVDFRHPRYYLKNWGGYTGLMQECPDIKANLSKGHGTHSIGNHVVNAFKVLVLGNTWRKAGYSAANIVMSAKTGHDFAAARNKLDALPGLHCQWNKKKPSDTALMQESMDDDMFDSAGAGLYANLWAGLPSSEGAAPVDMDAVRDGFAQVELEEEDEEEEEDCTPSYYGTGGAGKQAAKSGGKCRGKASRKKLPQKKAPRKGEVYRQSLMESSSSDSDSDSDSDSSDSDDASEARRVAAQMAARSKMQAYAARVAAQAQGSSSDSDSD